MRSPSVCLFIAMLVGLTTGPGAGTAAPKGGHKAQAAVAECRRDADCVLVPDGCCGCSEGGKQRALPSRNKDASEREREQRCRDTLCPLVMSTDPSCAARAVCKKGLCALRVSGGGLRPP